MRETWNDQNEIDLINEDLESTSLFSCLMLLIIISVVIASSFLLYQEFFIQTEGTSQTKAKLSWYWPPLLGANCAVAKNNECVSRMASGHSWKKWVGRAVACPEEYPFGTVFIIDGRRWVCMDRGGAITRINNNTIWLDLLTEKPLYKYGTLVNVTIIDK